MADSATTSARVVKLRPKPISPEAFAPYGKVLDQEQFVLRTDYFPMFTNVGTLPAVDEPITYVNRHHDHNQIFATFGEPMVVVVARPDLSAEQLQPSDVQAFLTDGKTAIVFHVDTWHLMPRSATKNPIRALNVQATNNRVHTERLELATDRGYVLQVEG
jgi:ureidoglycolate hydrolase